MEKEGTSQEGSKKIINKQRSLRRYVNIMLTLFGAAALAILFHTLLSGASGVKSFFAKLASVLAPFEVGILIAFVLKPLVKKLVGGFERLDKKNRMKHKSAIAILISVVFFLMIIYVVMYSVLPQLISSIVGIIQGIPDAAVSMEKWMERMLAKNPQLLSQVENFTSNIGDQINEWANTNLLPTLQNYSSSLKNLVNGVGVGVKSVYVFLKNFVVGLIIAIYILAYRDSLKKELKCIIYALFPKSKGDGLCREMRFIDTIFTGFISGRIVDAMVIGILCFIGCNIFRFPYALLISVVVGVTNVIPFFGPFFGAIPSAIIILTVSPIKCLYFLIFILALQQLDGNVIGPRILGNYTGISSFWVLFATLFFGGMYGVIGMIMGVPVFAVFYDIASRLVKKGLEKRNNMEVFTELEKVREEDEHRDT